MYFADLHIHSRFSRATSRDGDLPHLELWARRKGIALVGTGDFTHPAWRAEMAEQLEEAEEGLYRLKPALRLPDDPLHIIIGVSNIDAQITEDQKLDAARQSAAAYSRIAQALAKDYFGYAQDTLTQIRLCLAKTAPASSSSSYTDVTGTVTPNT